MRAVLVDLVRGESGEDLIEYGLLAAFVATLAIAVIVTDPMGFKTSLVNVYMKAKQALEKS